MATNVELLRLVLQAAGPNVGVTGRSPQSGTHLDGLQVLLQVFTHETNAGILGREWYTSLMLQRRPIGRFVGDTYGERLRVIKATEISGRSMAG